MRTLIVAPAWVGDMVMAHTLVSLLREGRRACEIHLVAPRATAPLGGRMPGVDAVHELAVGHGELGLVRRRRLARKLRPLEFQAAYVLPNSFKSALIPWWAGIPNRTGWHGESRIGVLNDRRRLDVNRYPKMVDRFMALALPAGVPLPECRPRPQLQVNRSNRLAVVERLGLKEHGSRESPATPGENRQRRGGMGTHPQPNSSSDSSDHRALAPSRPVVLCPGAEYGDAKRWPAMHFAALARERLQAGQAVWLLGSAGDAAVGAEIARLAPGVTDLTGRTSLLDAVDLLSLADVVISNDSGLMHIACALDRRVVALFGSTSPEFTPPLGRAATVIEQPLDCRPCFQRQCPLQHRNCLRAIAPSRVVAALESSSRLDVGR